MRLVSVKQLKYPPLCRGIESLITEMSTTGVKVRCWRIHRSFHEVNLWRLWLCLRKLLDGVRIVIFCFSSLGLFGKQHREEGIAVHPFERYRRRCFQTLGNTMQPNTRGNPEE